MSMFAVTRRMLSQDSHARMIGPLPPGEVEANTGRSQLPSPSPHAGLCRRPSLHDRLLIWSVFVKRAETLLILLSFAFVRQPAPGSDLTLIWQCHSAQHLSLGSGSCSLSCTKATRASGAVDPANGHPECQSHVGGLSSMALSGTAWQARPLRCMALLLPFPGSASGFSSTIPTG